MKKIELGGPAASDQAIQEGRTQDVIVFESGRPVALITPFDEDDLEWYAREHDPEFIESIARARAQAKAGQYLTHEQLQKELGLK